MAGDRPSIEEEVDIRPMPPLVVDRFQALFTGSDRSSGRYSVKTGSGAITERAANRQDYDSHLTGMIHLGIVPLKTDGTSHFMAIDIDNHGPAGKDVDPSEIEKRVRLEGLPLVVCRSKSGGAHLYLFLKAAQKASKIRPLMQKWADQLGYPRAEIFPKQTELAQKADGTDRRSLHGNWINIPYQNAHSTNRYAIRDGKQLNIDEFLDYGEEMRWEYNERDVMSKGGTPLPELLKDGPPCLQSLFENKLEEGNRNNALFQAGVFLKRVNLDADEFNAKMGDFNAVVFVKPLSKAEVKKVANSTFNKEYNYRCGEEPCAGVCNRDLCLKRKFGVSSGDVMANEVPDFDRITKIDGTPIKWHLHFSGKRVVMTTEDLFEYKRFKMRVFEQTHIVLRPLKQLEWERHIQAAMSKPLEVRKVETANDIIMQDLMEYMRRASTDGMRPEVDRRNDLMRGVPSMISLRMSSPQGGDLVQWYYAFKVEGFIDWMIRRKKLTVPRHEMFNVLREILGEHAKRSLRIEDRVVKNIWVVDKSFVDNEPIPARDAGTEY